MPVTTSFTALRSGWTQFSANAGFTITNTHFNRHIWVRSGANPGGGTFGAGAHKVGPGGHFGNTLVDRTWWARACGGDTDITVTYEET